ncbi:MAG: cation:proton antiporter [Casimicrobiaceae bacterium]
MELTWWFIGIGGMLIVMNLSSALIARLPLSLAIVYFVIGVAIGPGGIGWIAIDPFLQSNALETISEVAVLVSLFACGSSIGSTLRRRHWTIPIRLASVAMLGTIMLLAAVGYWGLGFSLGAAILLAAIIAPTDPVLAGDVQVLHQGDRDRLRFGLTGEGGLNDGAAFPFVMLGLGLLGLHPLGELGWRWWAIDLVWAVCGGLLIGSLFGMALGRWLLARNGEEAGTSGSDAFLGLGLVAIAYGTALALQTYGFLAVFSASVALQWTVTPARKPGDGVLEPLPGDIAGETTAAVNARPAAPLQRFNEHLASLFEFGVVVIIGIMFAVVRIPLEAVIIIVALFAVIRPASVMVALRNDPLAPGQTVLASWFGIRGVGSLYYVMYAINHGVTGQDAQRLLGITIAVIVASIVLHGISVTPLMALYERRKSRRSASS